VKAAILYDDKDIRPGDAPEPQIGPDEVIVASEYVGICGTDLHVYRGEFKDRVNYPAILGHEFGGVIEQVGSNVRGFQVRDRVVVDPILSCHRCPACLSGHINACQTLKLLGIDVDGGFGQYVAVPSDRLLHLPEDIPMAYAPMVELYSIGHHVLNRGQVQPGETVAILGAGKVGLSVLDVLCHSAGAALTISTDIYPFRLQMAEKLGADYTINVADQDPVDRVLEITGGVGVDCVIETIGHYHSVGSQDAPLAQAVHMIRNGGRIVTVGLGEQMSAIHFKTFVIKEAQLIASRVTRGEFPRAIRLLAKGLLHPEMLITHEMPIKDIAAGFAKLDREEPETLKIVLDAQAW
jgi:(R,R)-butanediol dehydrogenase/meso-butanediol dehydrogenase/diacetyl reductase